MFLTIYGVEKRSVTAASSRSFWKIKNRLKFEDKKTLGLKLFQVWTNLTTVLLVEGKVRKLGLKLRIEKTKVATHIWRQKF